MKPNMALLYASILFFLVLLGVLFKATDEPWKEYQKQYNREVRKMEKAAGKGGPGSDLSVEIRQDVLKDLSSHVQVDRCRSCHVAIDDDRFKNGKQPLRTHPEIPEHPFGTFGCTVCHEGNGRAVNKYYAHGEDHFWPEPLLHKPFIEASCAKCHTDPYIKETPHLRRGKELFVRFACVACHTIKGFSRGTQGPELTEVGHKFKLDYLDESIRNPHANTRVTSMPKFPITEEDRADLVTFLKSQRGRPLVEAPLPLRVKIERWKELEPEKTEATIAKGKSAFEHRSCVACHKLEEKDGGQAPNLTFIGSVRSQKYIIEHLKNPRAHTPGSIMPTYWMSDSEIRSIAKYLTSLDKIDVPEKPAEQYKALCARCHGTKGGGDGIIAANLLPPPRQFVNAKFFNWLPEERAHRNILNGVPGTAMPPFKELLSKQQVEALFQFVRTHFLKSQRFKPVKPRKINGTNPYPGDLASVERGGQEFQKRCYGCHGRLANGNGPNSLDLQTVDGLNTRPRDLTDTPFFRVLQDKRLFESITYGIVGTAMPPFDYLPENTRWDLINFVRSVSKTGPTSQPKTTGGNQ
jgi:mono/diheme cytochrome c family protein